jgi:hypothetical protein
MQERITLMDDQITRMKEELIALREQEMQNQRELQAKELR